MSAGRTGSDSIHAACVFICPECGGNVSHVIDSRASLEKGAIRRRRQCDNSKCKKHFGTWEISDDVFYKSIERAKAFEEWIEATAKMFEKVSR
jgi:transcriptional regulator NrdR family protein